MGKIQNELAMLTERTASRSMLQDFMRRVLFTKCVEALFSKVPGDTAARKCCRFGTLDAIMKPTVMYKIASVLLGLFAVGHTLGFRQADPQWGVDSLLQTMRSVHFSVNGF